MAMRQTDSEPPVEESSRGRHRRIQRGYGHSNSGRPPAPDRHAARPARPSKQYVTMLYALLDQARERSEQALASVRAQGAPGGTHQARLERDVSSAEHEKRLTQLNNTERGLCFGRTDDEHRRTLYIGRIGLRDDDYDLKLIDWRAPAARPFYAATPRSPQGLVRRRHIYTRPAGHRRRRRGLRPRQALRQRPGDAVRRGGADRRRVAARAPAGWATSWPPSRPSRTA